VADVWKALPAVISSLVLGGFGVLVAWISHWKIQDVSRRELAEALEDRREYAEERDKILVGVREEMAAKDRKVADLAARLSELESQFVIVVGRELRCKRWIQEVRRLADGAAWKLPPWEGD